MVAWWMGAWGMTVAWGQSAGQLLTELDQLDVVGSVLYVAAHPDDENTRLIHWLGRHRGYRTAYLSMTRGGGGQNLIGAEQAERLGVVRTGELLAARSIDGGQQFFTRVRDFGYSKSPEETLRLWGHEEALEDVVRVIRTFRPDIVVTRFSEDGGGHGHHTASARLAAEAFERAADPTYDVDGLPVWRSSRLLRNESTWRRPKDSPIPDDWLSVDVGTYDSRSGESSGAVAARARSQHKSQGFGSAPRVGPIREYFTVTAGLPVRDGDPFGGIDMGWTRLDGGRRIEAKLARLRRRFDPRQPERALPQLASLHTHLGQLTDPHWRRLKQGEVERLMQGCAGLYVAARADTVAATPGSEVAATLTVAARRRASVRWVTTQGPPDASGLATEGVDVGGRPVTQEQRVTFAAGASLSRPHWLAGPATATRYAVDGSGGQIVADEPPVSVGFVLDVAGVRQTVRVPLLNSVTDPVRGEVLRPFELLPAVTATFGSRGLLVPRRGRLTVPLTFTAPTLAADDEPIEVAWAVDTPPGVTATAPRVVLAVGAPEQTVELQLSATPTAEPGPLTVRVDGQVAQQAHRIAYPHLPERTVLSDASQRLTPVTLDRGGVQRVGYLSGSGDGVPDVLRAVGYDVVMIDEAQLDDLDGFDAVVMGVRAYNTRPRLPGYRDALLGYVERGGTLVVQYNTSRRWSTLSDRIGPAPFEVGRSRVTDEAAAVTLLAPEHPLLVAPNRIMPRDFDGWVQERGLYFVEAWDEAYTPLFAMQDPDEDVLEGATLVTSHGKGTFIYTSLSFFRQLPAGVPGALRLFANLLAGGR